MPKPLTIGRVAKQADIHIETIRYYERRGLLPDPPRTEGGYRQYDAESVTRLRFIKEAQALGFTLEEIQGLLALRVDKETSCEDVRRQAEHKVADIQAKISALQAMHDALQEMRFNGISCGNIGKGIDVNWGAIGQQGERNGTPSTSKYPNPA